MDGTYLSDEFPPDSTQGHAPAAITRAVVILQGDSMRYILCFKRTGSPLDSGDTTREFLLRAGTYAIASDTLAFSISVAGNQTYHHSSPMRVDTIPFQPESSSLGVIKVPITVGEDKFSLELPSSSEPIVAFRRVKYPVF